MQLNHDLGRSIELKKPSHEQPLWRYIYGGKPKPFFHPLCTPAGHVLTLFEPSDHVWHRGLWYTIKFINGENFWEESVDGNHGAQRTLVPPTVTHGPAGEITVASQQSWIRPNGQAIASEERSFTYTGFEQDAYSLDFSFAITFNADVTLDRTPFTTWGGYGGLTFRGNRNWLQTKLLFDDGSTSDRPTPKISKWCDLSGLIDGARDSNVGIAMFDHPANPRHPTPFYGSTGAGHYYNAAFLFHEPMQLKAGETLTQRYRVIVHDHLMGVDQLNALYVSYTK